MLSVNSLIVDLSIILYIMLIAIEFLRIIFIRFVDKSIGACSYGSDSARLPGGRLGICYLVFMWRNSNHLAEKEIGHA